MKTTDAIKIKELVKPYTVSNVRKTRGMEGDGLTLTIKKGEQTVCDYEDWGDGGMPNVRYSCGEEAEKAFLASVKEFLLKYGTRPEFVDGEMRQRPFREDDFVPDATAMRYSNDGVDHFIEEYVEAIDVVKKLKKEASNKTIFLIDDDDSTGSYRSAPVKFNLSVEAQLRMKFPGVKILNNLLAVS